MQLDSLKLNGEFYGALRCLKRRVIIAQLLAFIYLEDAELKLKTELPLHLSNFFFFQNEFVYLLIINDECLSLPPRVHLTLLTNEPQVNFI